AERPSARITFGNTETAAVHFQTAAAHNDRVGAEVAAAGHHQAAIRYGHSAAQDVDPIGVDLRRRIQGLADNAAGAGQPGCAAAALVEIDVAVDGNGEADVIGLVEVERAAANAGGDAAGGHRAGGIRAVIGADIEYADVALLFARHKTLVGEVHFPRIGPAGAGAGHRNGTAIADTAIDAADSTAVLDGKQRVDVELAGAAADEQVA